MRWTLLFIAAAIAGAAFAPRFEAPLLPGFLASVASIVIVTELSSAYVFLTQFRHQGTKRLLWLGMAYLTSGCFVIPYLLTFPGVFSPTGLLGAGEQTAVCSWIAWHSLFPVIAGIAILFPTSVTQSAGSRHRLLIVMTAIVVAVVSVWTFVLITHAALLPVIVHIGRFTPLAKQIVLPGIVLLDLTAIGVILRSKPQTKLGAWLILALVASMLDATMGLLFARFTVGWYVGKIFSMLSSGVVLRAYLQDMLKLQFHLAQSRDELKRYELLAASARDIMIFVDRKTHKVLHVNKAAADALGYSDHEFAALTVDELAPHERRETASGEFAYAVAGVLIETEFVRKNGTVLPVEISARTAELNGHDVVLCVVRDISERKHSQELLEEALAEAVEGARLKGEFVATMSHEIRTPMNGVLGMTELLLESDLDAAQRESAETVRDSAQALMRIINDVLDFSKMEAGKLDIEAVAFSVAPVVEGVIALLRAGASKDVAVTAFVSPKIPIELCGDPGRLRQVLINLVGNALKFTPAGSVTISADLVPTANDVVLRFTVRDTGIGISAEAQAKLFQPFVQADGSTTKRFGGTGLGLSIARRLVQLMGGEIEVTSNPGTGTTMSFTVSFQAVRESAVVISPFQDARILVIDVEPEASRMLERYAGSWGMRYAAARDGATALTKLMAAARDGKPFDVAIVDKNLRDMQAAEFGHRVAGDPLLSKTTLLLLTGPDEGRRRDRESSPGFADSIAIPIQQSRTYNALLRALRPSALERVGASAATKAAASPPRKAGGAKPNILVVEDNEINQRVAARQLHLLDYDFEIAANGREALERIATGDFDVILMDCHMPVMDGYEAARAIRASEIETVRTIPIFAMTANALERDKQKCLDAGMDRYLTKPMKLGELDDALRTQLQLERIPQTIA